MLNKSPYKSLQCFNLAEASSNPDFLVGHPGGAQSRHALAMHKRRNKQHA